MVLNFHQLLVVIRKNRFYNCGGEKALLKSIENSEDDIEQARFYLKK